MEAPGRRGGALVPQLPDSDGTGTQPPPAESTFSAVTGGPGLGEQLALVFGEVCV